MTYDLVKQLQDDLQADGFATTIVKHQDDNTLVMSYTKDGYEVTVVIPGVERNKRTNWEYLNN